MLSVAVGAGRLATHAGEELAERGGVGEREAFGYLGNGEAGGGEEPRGLDGQHLVDVLHDGAPGHLADDAREVGGGDAETVGIEGDVVVLGVVLAQEGVEGDEEVLRAARDVVGMERVLLDIDKVEYEDGVEILQHLVGEGGGAYDVATDGGDVVVQQSGIVGREREFRFAVLYDWIVGGADEVAEGRGLVRHAFVDEQYDGLVVGAHGQDAQGEAGQIDEHLTLVDGDFPPAGLHRQVAAPHEGEGVARQRVAQLVGLHCPFKVADGTGYPALP